MSLPVQDKETLAEVARHPGWTFGGAFKDVQTGTNPTRTDYQRMLTAARVATAAGKRVMIVVVRQNRFGRDGEEALRAWKEFERLSAELWATRDGGHLADPLMYGVRAILAEHDVRQISENVKETFAEIRANGWLKPGRLAGGDARATAAPGVADGGAGPASRRGAVRPRAVPPQGGRRVGDVARRLGEGAAGVGQGHRAAAGRHTAGPATRRVGRPRDALGAGLRRSQSAGGSGSARRAARQVGPAL
jgi:hypothetical protein